MIAGIIGYTGYTGSELLKILNRHPNIDRINLFSDSISTINEFHEQFSFTGNKKFQLYSRSAEQINDCEILFFCTPEGYCLNNVSKYYDKKKLIIDLSPDFRIKDITLWKKWYKVDHTEPAILKNSIYGLSEFFRKELQNAKFISNPGCYATIILLSILPIADLINNSKIVIDAKSGLSGAGKKLVESNLFSEVNENFKPYAISGHRHSAEIFEVFKERKKENLNFSFIPHLLPITKGILVTIHTNLKYSDLFFETMKNYYIDSPFVKVLSEGHVAQLKMVLNTNNSLISLHRDQNDNLIICGVLDNLIKGASGQAVQNMNLALGFDEATALI
jgi:N-acetyl-gamma-glutamyl-phosphate reductase